MNEIPDKLLEKFISGKRLTESEFLILDKLFNNVQYQNEIFRWMENKWQYSTPETVSLQFEQIREKIRSSSSKQRLNRLFIVLSKAAAVLFIPLLAVAFYFYISQINSAELLTLATQKGEQTSVILPDGSKAWLNVDTKLSYPVNYGIKSRKLKLEGEAYFEVAKNEGLPFEVSSENITTKALGTRFAVSAYPGSSEIRSSLIEGSVEVAYGDGYKILKPGQQFFYKKGKPEIIVRFFDEADELAWKNEQLVFRLTPFDKVIEKLERWYNVGFNYNPAIFRSETLTVKFEKSETLENVLQVMSKANGFKYRIDGGNVIILK